MNSDVTPDPVTPASVPRWTVHPAVAANDEELRQLFQSVFGHAMSPALWNWKYRHAALRGTLLRRGEKAVAFFGGMPRRFVHRGKVHEAVQNGDVMVAPDERGVFSRHGALYQVAADYFGSHVGPGQRYEFAFGFPSQRHFRLGAKLGLYVEVGRMMELRWTPQPKRRHVWWHCEPLAQARGGDLDALWRRMQHEWPDLYLPLRDAERWRYRYLQHPGQPYELLIVRRRWTGAALAAMALREHPSHCEWLDYVGPRSGIALAAQAVREWAGAKGKPLTALVSDTVVALFAAQADSVHPSQIQIPVNAPQGQQIAPPWAGRFWFMGGDSDFL
jgi:hypothetical protein